MALSADAARSGGTTNRLLNKLAFAVANDAADIATATTSDILVMLDASDDYEVKYADSANVLEMIGTTATAAELTRATDVSTRLVTITADTSITEVLHEGKTCLLGEVGGNASATCTLPAATGGGARYRFVVSVVNTSNYVFKSVVGTDIMYGALIGDDGGAVTTTLRWQAGAADDTVTLNGSTTGGVTIGDWIEFEDILATGWAVRGVISQSGTEATPFSDSVA